MSAMYSTDVQCDKCGQWIHGSSCKSIRKARERSKNFGWITKKEDDKTVDICPTCQGKPYWEHRDAYGGGYERG